MSEKSTQQEKHGFGVCVCVCYMYVCTYIYMKVNIIRNRLDLNMVASGVVGIRMRMFYFNIRFMGKFDL